MCVRACLQGRTPVVSTMVAAAAFVWRSLRGDSVPVQRTNYWITMTTSAAKVRGVCVCVCVCVCVGHMSVFLSNHDQSRGLGEVGLHRLSKDKTLSPSLTVCMCRMQAEILLMCEAAVQLRLGLWPARLGVGRV